MRCELCDRKIAGFLGIAIQGGHICKSCRDKLPKLVRVGDFDAEYLKNLIVSRSFTPTASLGTFFIDEMDYLFCISDREGTPKDLSNVFRIKDIAKIAFELKNVAADSSNRVFCDIGVCIELRNPRLFIDQTIKRHVKCESRRTDNTHISYEQPAILSLFRSVFNQMVENLYDRTKEYFADFKDMEKYEYVKAKALFMTEDDYTAEEIRHTRNLLMKAFHPDNGEGTDDYGQKINHAYRVLMENLS